MLISLTVEGTAAHEGATALATSNLLPLSGLDSMTTQQASMWGRGYSQCQKTGCEDSSMEINGCSKNASGVLG